MFSSNYLIYAIICIGIFTIYMALMNLLRSDRYSARVSAAGGLPDEGEGLSIGSFAEFCEKVNSLFALREEERKKRIQQLMSAGIQSPHAITYITFYDRVVQPVLLVFSALIWVRIFALGGLSGTGWAIDVALSIACYIFARGGVDMYLRRRRKFRQRILLRYFPEVLDLLLVCIESGLGLDAALARASRELDVIHPLIVSELDRTRLELTLLADRVLALQNLAERTGIVPFRALVAALIQTEKFGTSLVDTLRVLAEDQRVTRLLDTENKVAKIPALVTIPLILCILPSFMIILMGPPLIGMIDGGGLKLAPVSEKPGVKPGAKLAPPAR